MSTDRSTSHRAHSHYARFTSPPSWRLACSLLFAGCGGSESDAAPDPAATRGAVIAEVPTTTIGAQGGRVTSSDGRAWLDPARALSQDVVWSISAETPKLPSEFISGYEAVADSGYLIPARHGVRFSRIAASLQVEGAAGCPELREISMNPCVLRVRLARPQRESDVSVAPALLVFAACATLVLAPVLALSSMPNGKTPARTAEPA